MAQEKKKVSLDQVLQLVDQLSSSEQEDLRQKLNSKSWGERWDRLAERIQAKFKAEGVRMPSEDEVMVEVKAVRQERKAQRD